MRTTNKLLKRLLIWRIRNINSKNFMMFMAVAIGFLGGIAAVIIKNTVHLIDHLLTSGLSLEYHNYLYFLYPIVGILIAATFIHLVLRQHVGHGIPSVLFAISKNSGIIKRHNVFSSVLSATVTVGFGGSVGLEGPTVATGAAIGSNLGQLFRLNYKQISLCLALACSAAMAAIFKSPIAAVVFAVEVIMIDLTLASIIPLLLASATAVLTSYFFLGQAVPYPFEIKEGFSLDQIPFYIVLGIFAGLVSVYFTKVYIFVEKQFRRIKKWYYKWMIGGAILGLLIFLFPSLYGEGYDAINTSLNGDPSALYNGSIFYAFKDNMYVIFGLFILVILAKAVATSVTFGAGGIGGIFAPTLFLGVFSGLFYAKLVNFTGLGTLPEANFALVGMGGLIAGVLHGPLTSIFLIAEITDGYALFVPLMITSTVSYATTKVFVSNSVYTYQLARRGELFTHHKDKVVLSMMKVEKLIETNFKTVKPENNLGEMVKVISESNRNVFPVIDEHNYFYGIVRLDDIRNIMFRPELYETTYVDSLMVQPAVLVSPDDSMEEVAKKFQESGKFNMPVVKDGVYMGFVSRARVFSKYRALLKHFSDD